MEEYRSFVAFLSASGEDRVFLNSDEDKMLIVFTEMFRSAQLEFRIFAGSLCNDTTEKDEYIETLSDFIEKKGALKILLNSYNDKMVLKSNLFKRLAYYQSLGYDIQLKKTTEDVSIDLDNEIVKLHIAIGDREAYRIETNIVKRTAICNMHDPIRSGEFADYFDRMFSEKNTESINLISLFKIEKQG